MTHTTTEWEKRMALAQIPSSLQPNVLTIIQEAEAVAYERGKKEERERIKRMIQNIEKVDVFGDIDAHTLEDHHVIKMARSSYDDLIAALTPQDTPTDDKDEYETERRKFVARLPDTEE